MDVADTTSISTVDIFFGHFNTANNVSILV